MKCQHCIFSKLLKLSLIYSLVLFFLLPNLIFTYAAPVSHNAYQVVSGTFGAGDYTFPDKLTVSGDATLMDTVYVKKVEETVQIGSSDNLALGKTYTYNVPPSDFPDAGGELTNGNNGCGAGTGELVGWHPLQSSAPTITIDLGIVAQISQLKYYIVNDDTRPTYMPEVQPSTSTDNIIYTNWGALVPYQSYMLPYYCQATASDYNMFLIEVDRSFVSARYVRLDTNYVSGGIMNIAEIEVYGPVQTATNVYNRVGIGTSTPTSALDIAGDVRGSSFQTSSDTRFKTNVVPLTNILPKLDYLHPVSFDWNNLYQTLGRATPGRQVGLIAQDVEKVFPELVSSWGTERYRDIDYGRMSAILLQAVKEQQAEIKEQHVTIKEQNKKIEKQQTEIDALRTEITKLKTDSPRYYIYSQANDILPK